jgi:predicted outer membrane protein
VGYFPLSRYAVQNGKRDDVKAFGQRMVKDHSALNDALQALAAKNGVTLLS